MYKYATGTSTPLSGAEFLVTDSFGTNLGPDNGRYVTDVDGRFVVDGLTPGVTVTVRETRTVDGYLLDAAPQSIGIRSGAVQSLTFYNTPRSALQILKKDAVTGQPLAGAVFQVMNSRGEYIANNGGRLTSNGVYSLLRSQSAGALHTVFCRNPPAFQRISGP